MNTETIEKCLAIFNKVNWINVPGFSIGEHEGYKNLSFGIAAGPSKDIGNVIHEIAHACDMVDMKQKRLAYYNFGIEITSFQDIDGNRYYEPKTNQATLLECRVFAIQKHIMEALNIDTIGFFNEATNILKWVADYSLTNGSWLSASDNKWKTWRLRMLHESYNNTNINVIKDQWKRAIDVITKVEKQLA